jgi:hypothetical protein
MDAKAPSTLSKSIPTGIRTFLAYAIEQLWTWLIDGATSNKMTSYIFSNGVNRTLYVISRAGAAPSVLSARMVILLLQMTSRFV